MLLASTQPYVSTGGSFGLFFGALFTIFCVAPFFSKVVHRIFGMVAFWASITVLVFLRKGMGVRALSIKHIVIGILFLYFVGNMVGHNYHDMYRDVGATVWGARVHFTYLVLFIVMAVYRRVEATLNLSTTQPSSWGMPSNLAEYLPTHSKLERRGEFYKSVVMEPLAVVSIGLGVALLLRNWFGWYLVLTGCLLFYCELYCYYLNHEALLDMLDGGAPS